MKEDCLAFVRKYGISYLYKKTASHGQPPKKQALSDLDLRKSVSLWIAVTTSLFDNPSSIFSQFTAEKRCLPLLRSVDCVLNFRQYHFENRENNTDQLVFFQFLFKNKQAADKDDDAV
jgi:hypothetical protein